MIAHRFLTLANEDQDEAFRMLDTFASAGATHFDLTHLGIDLHRVGNFDEALKTFAGIETKVTQYDWGKEVAPGITSIAAPGHTPGVAHAPPSGPCSASAPRFPGETPPRSFALRR